MSYFDDVDPENMPKTPVEVLTIMIDRLQELRSEVEYLYDEAYSRLSYKNRTEVLFESRAMINQAQQDQKELMSRAVKMFMRAYYEEIDLIDRLRHE